MFAACCSQIIAKTTNAQFKLTFSENVAYNTVSSTQRMATLAKVTLLENVAYDIAVEVKEDHESSRTPSHTVIYDEVTPK